MISQDSFFDDYTGDEKKARRPVIRSSRPQMTSSFIEVATDEGFTFTVRKKVISVDRLLSTKNDVHDEMYKIYFELVVDKTCRST